MKLLNGSSSKSVLAILRTGVIPLPAAKAAIVLVLAALASKTKRPFGSATSKVSPVFKVVLA